MIYIYTYVCPLSNIVVYVGKTARPDIRHYQHTKGASLISHWIRAMENMGWKPVLKVIDQAETSYQAGKLEAFYIKKYASIGQACHNVSQNNRNHACRFNFADRHKTDASPIVREGKKKMWYEIQMLMYKSNYYDFVPDYAMKQVYRLLLKK